ncbi:MAG TPA: FapA family protein, partial [Spirochaetia bacterium]|nr:FapA family protein [Spirochaetia bacterium]
GIIGRKPGMVRVGKTVKALFLEHCQVEALGTIHVTKALLHTRVYTNGNLELDEGGRVVSSTVWVRGVLTCAQLGGENGQVKVVAGSDFVVQRKMDAVRHRYQVLEDEVRKLKAHGQEPNAEQVAALGALVAEMNTLSPLLFSNPATEVRVTSKVHEGTVLEMGFASLTVTKPLKGQLFKLSPDGKTILSFPLSKDSPATGDGKESAPAAE